jgi:hypothetical protein
MCDFEDYKILSAYSRQQAIEDGVLVEVFDQYTMKKLSEFTKGKKIVVTSHLANDVDKHDLRNIWNGFAVWKQEVEETLPEEERLYKTSVKGKTVWVIEDAEAFTLMYPSDY